ncbi:MAG: OsmC family protein [Desulfovibrio sp.]|nr:OsmC family protein [Desulfovibrio sp.]
MEALMECAYKGGMLVSCRDQASGAELAVEAGVNEGRSHCSPPDLCAAALASCLMTIIAGYAEVRGLGTEGLKASVATSVRERPYSILRLAVTFSLSGKGWSEHDRTGVSRAIRSCPVHKAFGPQIAQEIAFDWLD